VGRVLAAASKNPDPAIGLSGLQLGYLGLAFSLWRQGWKKS